MANLTKGGFRVWGTFSGGEGVFPGTKFGEVANNYGTSIFKYDILTAVSDGTLAQSATSDNGKIIGVAVGFYVVLAGRKEPYNYIPASTTFTPSTVGSPTASQIEYIPLTGDVILEVDGNAAAPTPTVAGVLGLVGENCDLSAATAGDTTTGLSGMTLDLSTHNTTTFNFRIVGVSEYPHMTTNDPTLSRCKFLVVLNEGILPPYTPTGV